MKYLPILAILALTGCGKSHHDSKPLPVTPVQLGLASFQSPIFSDLAWEDKCVGTKQFFIDFQKQYLPESELTFSAETCKREVDFGDLYWNVIEPIFKNEGQTLNLQVYLRTRFETRTNSLLAFQSGISRKSDQNGSSNFVYLDTDAAIGGNLVHLAKTFEAWLTTDAEKPATVFGFAYPDYLQEVKKKIGPDSEGLKLTEPKMTFKLIPGKDGIAEGTVLFSEVELSKKLLNCLDQTCLNESPISYKIAGPRLTLLSPETVTSELNGIPVRERVTFSIDLDFLIAPRFK